MDFAGDVDAAGKCSEQEQQEVQDGTDALRHHDHEMNSATANFEFEY